LFIFVVRISLTLERLKMGDFKVDEVKMREKLYRCIIGQLLNDGYMAIAKTLTSQVKPITPCVPSDNLYKAYLAGQDQVRYFFMCCTRVPPFFCI